MPSQLGTQTTVEHHGRPNLCTAKGQRRVVPYFTFYGEREHNLFDLGTQAGAFDNIERARSLKDI